MKEAWGIQVTSDCKPEVQLVASCWTNLAQALVSESSRPFCDVPKLGVLRLGRCIHGAALTST